MPSLHALQLLATQLHLTGPRWRLVDALNERFTALGCPIIRIFVASWRMAALIYRLSGREDLEASTG